MNEIKFHGFDRTSENAVLCTHLFYVDRDKSISHDINGDKRANIPPEGWRDYALIYPEIIPLIDSLTKRLDNNDSGNGSPDLATDA